MSYGPCLCGATDCPRCYPGCNTPTECEVCGEDAPRWKMIDCPTCSRSMCEACAQEHADERCNKCHEEDEE